MKKIDLSKITDKDLIMELNRRNAKKGEEVDLEPKNLIPLDFAESSESHCEFRWPAEKAIDILKQCEYIDIYTELKHETTRLHP